MKATKLLIAACIPLLGACGSNSDGTTESSMDDLSKSGPAGVPIANFVKVTDGIYRGGHPSSAGLDYLKQLGIKTIVNLEVGDFAEAFPWDIDAELRGAASRNITEVREPMSAFEPALSDNFDKRVDGALAVLRDPAKRPVYVHCKHGQDRTGLIIGLERVLNEGWAPKDAFNEMIQHGFHKGFLGLDEYFERKTGWQGE